MKETVKINLNQRLYDLDADAYNALKKYLDSLKIYFNKMHEESEEIIADIEQRISEILEEKLGGIKQAITIIDIQEIIKTMGTPDDFARDNAYSKEENPTEEKFEKESFIGENERGARRLYRDRMNNILGGVCAGMAEYFNTDPVWVRIAFVVLFFFNGVGLITYIVLWAVVPAARTTAQRLQMKGKPVTIDNIQDSVKAEFSKVRDNLNDISKGENYRRLQDFLSEFFSLIGRIVLVLFKIVFVIIMVALIISSVVLIGVLIAGVSLGWGFIWEMNPPQLIERHLDQLHYHPYFLLAMILVLLIPVLGILWAIVKYIFNIKTHNRTASAFLWTFWALILVYVIVTWISADKRIGYNRIIRNDFKLSTDTTHILYLKSENTEFFNKQLEFVTLFDKEIICEEDSEVCYVHPNLTIKSTKDSCTHLVTEYSTIFAFNKENHIDEKKTYQWDQKDTVLVLSNYLRVNKDYIWQLPRINLILLIPDGQKFYIDQKLSDIMDKEQFTKDSSNSEYFNRPLVIDRQEIKELPGSTVLK